jgi:hypothetical protein
MDAVCQGLADARTLTGTWKAWLSSAAGTASARLTQATVPYRLLDGNTIATNWNDLTDGTLSHPIDVREDGTGLGANVEVWTGSRDDGSDGAFNCSSWSSTSGSAIIGVSNSITFEWSYSRQEFCSAGGVHLYCFEQ